MYLLSIGGEIAGILGGFAFFLFMAFLFAGNDIKQAFYRYLEHRERMAELRQDNRQRERH